MESTEDRVSDGTCKDGTRKNVRTRLGRMLLEYHRRPARDLPPRLHELLQRLREQDLQDLQDLQGLQDLKER
jgi:hypothetical protein